MLSLSISFCSGRRTVNHSLAIVPTFSPTAHPNLFPLLDLLQEGSICLDRQLFHLHL